MNLNWKETGENLVTKITNEEKREVNRSATSMLHQRGKQYVEGLQLEVDLKYSLVEIEFEQPIRSQMKMLYIYGRINYE